MPSGRHAVRSRVPFTALLATLVGALILVMVIQANLSGGGEDRAAGGGSPTESVPVRPRRLRPATTSRRSPPTGPPSPGSINIAEAARVRLGAAQRDRVDRGLGPLRQVEHFFERDQARRVLAVREDDERLAADVLVALRLDLAELLERDVDRVVQRGRAAGDRLADRAFEVGLVRRERLPDRDAAVEVDDLREVVRLEPLARNWWRPPAASRACLPCSRCCRGAATARSAAGGA